MYIIIVGAGDIGSPLIDISTRSGDEVVVIERDQTRADEVAQEYDCLVLHADATSKDTLADADAGRADAVISTTEQDATNVMVCLLAEEFGVPTVTAVVHNPEHRGLFQKIGVNTIENPQELLADHLYRAVARPAIVDYMRIGKRAEVFEITVTDTAPVAGKTLTQIGEDGSLNDDVLIVAVEREGVDRPLTPRGNTRIEAGDTLTVYSATGADPELTDVFGHHEDDPN
ncbi:MAG: K+ transport system, NAD-binding component [halophilic archaeon J07HB67]|jgi:K+ transport systems, NAD-binding component|nr:MAG: K+ transport system, NAD-binding component [halophilic archaeon J07HB67]